MAEPEPPRVPEALEAEQALLAAILVNHQAIHRVAAFLKPEHFRVEVHGRIYAAALQLVNQGRVANPVSLAPLFRDDPALADRGGAKYLASLVSNVVSVINAESYGHQIAEAYRNRCLLEIADEIRERALTPSLDPTSDETMNWAEERFLEIGGEGAANEPVTLGQATARAIERADVASRGERVAGLVLSGFEDIDHRLGGFWPGELTILAGRPSMGKTALALGMAWNAAKWKDPVAFFSLEMPADDLGQRCLAMQSGISAEQQRLGKVSPDEIARLVDEQTRMARMPIYIDDNSKGSVAKIRARAVRLKRQHGIRAIFVDYLQLLSSDDARSRVEEVSKISRDLKVLAKDLALPVIALSQLSRAVESRDDKRPTLADLRESGSIEQDADVVMFVYREEYYLQQAEPQPRPEDTDARFQERWARWSAAKEKAAGKAEILIRKSRHGRPGTVALQFNDKLTLFGDINAPFPDPGVLV